MIQTIYIPDIQGIGQAYLKISEALSQYKASSLVPEGYEVAHPELDQATEAIKSWLSNPTAAQAKIVYDFSGPVERIGRQSNGQALAWLAKSIAWLCDAIGVEIRYDHPAAQSQVQQDDLKASIEYAGTAQKYIDSF